MEWIQQNWVFILFFIFFIGVHLFGHGAHGGGCGGHGSHGKENEHKGHGEKGTVPDLRAKRSGDVESGLSPDTEKKEKKGGHGCC